MFIKILPAGVALILGVCAPVMAANSDIQNPASRINNPASRMYNPASNVNNPAANIYNPATQLNDPNPLSPVSPPAAPEAAAQATKNVQPPQARLAIPRKSYKYTTVKQYIRAAKKAFTADDYMEFISITESALRRINSGKLKASDAEKEKLEKYKALGYGLLEPGQ